MSVPVGVLPAAVCRGTRTGCNEGPDGSGLMDRRERTPAHREFVVVWDGRGGLPGERDWPTQRRPIFEVERKEPWFTGEELAKIAKYAPEREGEWYPQAKGRRKAGRPKGYPASGAAATPRPKTRLEPVTVCGCTRRLTPTEIHKGLIRCRVCRRARRAT